MNFASMIDLHARSRGDAAAAIAHDGRVLTWSEAASQVARVASGLRRVGIDKGERIALLLTNTPEFFVSFFAILRAGGCAVPINTRWTKDEVAFAVGDSGARMLITSSEFQEVARHLQDESLIDSVVFSDIWSGSSTLGISLDELADGEPLRWAAATMNDDLADIIYTAGTSGKPKGVPHGHGFLATGAFSRADLFELRADDVGLSLSPLFHIGGLAVMTVGAAIGATTVFMPKWNVEEFLRLIDAHGVTYMHLVTTLLVDLERSAPPLLDQYDTSSLRVTFGGGGAATASQYAFYEQRIGGLFCEGYGRTEASGVAWNPADAELRKDGSNGYVLCSVAAVRIVDSDGADCVPGGAGEIFLRGDGVARGYWNRPELTTQTFDSENWMHTGDIGSLDDDGFITFTGRIDRMIKTGGENVYPDEVEEVLLSMPAIAEVAVAGVPDERLGTAVGAVVVSNEPGLTQEDVLTWCRGRMASYKRPRIVVVADRLEKLGSRKVDYRVVVALLETAKSEQ